MSDDCSFQQDAVAIKRAVSDSSSGLPRRTADSRLNLMGFSSSTDRWIFKIQVPRTEKDMKTLADSPAIDAERTR